jgi:hypothetical protein
MGYDPTEVLMLIAQGRVPHADQPRPGIAEETARTHIERAVAKLGLRDRA